MAVNMLYEKEKGIYLAYMSKYNSPNEKQIIVLMISNAGMWMKVS